MFRSQTSDHMDRSSRGGKSQRRERKKKEDQRREEATRSRKKIKARKKVEKYVWKHCVFPMFCALEGRKVDSLKRRVQSHLDRWEIKNCRSCGAKRVLKTTRSKHLILGALLEVEIWDVGKVNTPCSEHFWHLRCSESARRCGAKHVSKSKVKIPHVRTTFGRWIVILRGMSKGFCTLPKIRKTLCFVAVSKTMAVGRLKRICKDVFHLAGVVQKTSPLDMFRGQGADFLTRCILEHQIVRFAKIILRDRTWPHCFVAGAIL